MGQTLFVVYSLSYGVAALQTRCILARRASENLVVGAFAQAFFRNRGTEGASCMSFRLAGSGCGQLVVAFGQNNLQRT